MGGALNRKCFLQFPAAGQTQTRPVWSSAAPLAPPTAPCSASRGLKSWHFVSGAEERLQRGDHGDQAGGGDGDVRGRL